MEKKDFQVIKEYLKFILKDKIKTDEEIEAYASSISEEKLALIRYYVNNGVIMIPKSSIFSRIRDKFYKPKTEEEEVFYKLKRKAIDMRRFFIDEESFLKDLREYERNIRKIPEKNLIKFLKRLGYFDICNDDEKFQEFINNLTVDQLKNILVTFNNKLNRLNIADKKNRRKDMRRIGANTNPSWYGATDIVIDDTLSKLLDALKSLKDRKSQAMLTYYTLLYLHMFVDGNGRTSRFIYDLILGSNELQDNFVWYFHSEDDKRMYTGSFEEQREIMDIKEVTGYLYENNIEILKKYNIELPEDFPYKKISNKITERFPGHQIVNDIPIRSDILEKLTEKQVDMINHLLKDNIEIGSYSVGGLIIFIILSQKNNLKRWIEKNESPDELIFDFNKNQSLFDNWTLEDYLKVIEIGNNIKQEMFNNLIDIFTNPEKHPSFGINHNDNNKSK